VISNPLITRAIVDLRGESISDASEISLMTFANRSDHSLVFSYDAKFVAPVVEDVDALADDSGFVGGSGGGVTFFFLLWCCLLIV
jgi:hypothetical protein